MPVGPVTRDESTKDFFDGTAQGAFLLRICPAGHCSSPQAGQCESCGTTELSYAPASGDAQLISWAVLPAPAVEEGAGGRTVTVLAIAELSEGPWWWSQIVEADPGKLAVGMPLTIAFEHADGDSEVIPVFNLSPG